MLHTEPGYTGSSQKRRRMIQHRIAQAPSTFFLDSPEAGLPLSCEHHRLLILRQHQHRTQTSLLILSQETAGGPTPP